MNKSKIIGLMSGTSLDGIDAVLVDIEKENSGKFNVKYIDMDSISFEPEVLDFIKLVVTPKKGTIEKLVYLNFVLGEHFAKAVLKLLDKTGLKREDVDLISCSGLTVCNLPKRNNPLYPKARMQIGELAIIAERTGIDVVGDFRPGDVAAGGEGAPLIPFFDFHTFCSDEKNRLILNIGGISNVTYLKASAGVEDVIAFDTGPGNMIINNYVSKITGSSQKFDRDGLLAKKGRVNKDLQKYLISNQFIYLKPPKSTGREEFGEKYLEEIINFSRNFDLDEFDILATITHFTADAIYKNCELFLGPIDEIIMSGGGVYNKEIIRYLKNKFINSKFYLTDDFNIPSKAKEAMGFALLGYSTKNKLFNNVPAATGAMHPVVMGKLVCSSL